MGAPKEVAFVAGATGYTGTAVVRELRGRGIRTVAHVRPGAPGSALVAADFAAQGAVVDRTSWDGDLAAALRDHRVTHLFALLGTTRARSRRAAAEGRTETYETVDYGLTRRLLVAASEIHPSPRIVYLSSLGASHPRGNAYLLARARVEAELRSGRVPFVIVRPSFITGPDRRETRPLERGAAAMADALLGAMACVGAAAWRDQFASMTAEELAGHLVRLAFDPAATGRTFEPRDLRGHGREASAA